MSERQIRHSRILELAVAVSIVLTVTVLLSILARALGSERDIAVVIGVIGGVATALIHAFARPRKRTVQRSGTITVRSKGDGDADAIVDAPSDDCD